MSAYGRVSKIALGALVAAVLVLPGTAAAQDRPASPAAQASPINWYRPTEADARLPWNSRDPWQDWGDSYRVAFSTSPNARFAGAANDVPAEIGLRFDGSYYGLIAGRQISGPKSYILGASMFRNAGWNLYDGKSFDYAVGLTWPNFEVRYVSDFDNTKIMNGNISVTGGRFIWADAGEVDLRIVLPGIWIDLDSKDVTWTWSLSFDLGFVF